jgi:hypothetical protein
VLYERLFNLIISPYNSFDFQIGLFDLLDERPLSKAELHLFCGLLFGTHLNEIPDPISDWDSFISYVEDRLGHEIPQWNPLTKKIRPWINLKKLNSISNESGCRVS